MSYRTEREDFCARMARAFPALSIYTVGTISRKLMRLAGTRQRLAVEQCNGPEWKDKYPELWKDNGAAWETDLEARVERCVAAIARTCEPYGLDFEAHGDPRGAVLQIRFGKIGEFVVVPS